MISQITISTLLRCETSKDCMISPQLDVLRIQRLPPVIRASSDVLFRSATIDIYTNFEANYELNIGRSLSVLNTWGVMNITVNSRVRAEKILSTGHTVNEQSQWLV